VIDHHNNDMRKA